MTNGAKITSTTVARLKVGDILWDGELRRFGVRRRTRETTYFVKVRINRAQKWITIGKHGPLTAAEAREKARRVLAAIDDERYARR